jgi:hypothetical protein
MSKDNNKFDPLNMPGPDPGKPKHTKEEIDKAKENALSKQLSEAKKDNNSLVAHAAEAGVFLSKNNKEIIDKFYHRAKYGHQGAMPMMCKGQSCRFLNMCPLAEAKVELPINKRCPVEGSLIEIWAGKLIQSLSIEVDNPDYAVDMDMVYELAGLELIRNRAAVHLSDDPDLFKEKVVGYSPQGDKIYDSKPNLALLILEKYGKRVDKLREQLLATRHSQARLGKLTSDNSVRAANIRRRAQEIAQTRKDGGKIEDADFSIREKEEEEEE